MRNWFLVLAVAVALGVNRLDSSTAQEPYTKNDAPDTTATTAAAATPTAASAANATSVGIATVISTSATITSRAAIATTATTAAATSAATAVANITLATPTNASITARTAAATTAAFATTTNAAVNISVTRNANASPTTVLRNSTLQPTAATSTSAPYLSISIQLALLTAQLQAYKSQLDSLNTTLANVQAASKLLASEAQKNLTDLRSELKLRTDSAKNLTTTLFRQVSAQQLFVEERIRSDGHSGIKRVRGSQDGTKAYYQNKIATGSTALASHDHSNYNNTPGLGEFIAVMNGVEFRTRHNDYKLVMPSNTSKAYQATQPIPFPQVPPQVTAKTNVSDQISEMRQWFKAWRDQNYTVRDYRPYFKPIMCYLEGSWTRSTNIDEPFSSERHAIEARSWLDLTDKIEFTSYTGRKNLNENYAFLPTKIVSVLNDTPIYAQWNYRILCHPISFDLPLKVFQPVDELSIRLKLNLRYDQLSPMKVARFRVGPDTNWNGANKEYNYNSLVDRIMREIPGTDNYGANITDDVLFNKALYPGSTSQPLNGGYYHRWSSLQKQDAMGLSLTRTGFNDENVFVALPTQTQVAGRNVTDCFNATTCPEFEQRVTYAIPLEIIYLTPLQSWNPYNLSINPINTVTKNAADGSSDNPYNGTNPAAYHYLTPVEFFSGGEINRNPADTNAGSVTVLDKDRTPRNVTASGVRILFPNVPGVGVLRQRYPVFPIHEEGSYTFAEVEAIKDALMDQVTYRDLYRQRANFSIPSTPGGGLTGVTLVTSVAPVPRPHEHTLDLTASERDILLAGGTVEKVSSIAESHNHVIVIGWRPSTATSAGAYLMQLCNGEPVCRDGHATLSLNSN